MMRVVARIRHGAPLQLRLDNTSRRKVAMRSRAGSLSRQWVLLRAVPKQPRKITTAELMARLRAEGFNVTRRTVERDLIALSAEFPLVSDERAKPFGWSWQKDASQFSVPGMSPLQALVLNLARAHLGPMLPAHLIGALEPYFAQASATLQTDLGPRGISRWNRHVAVVPPSQPLLPPVVNDLAISTVHEALSKERQLELHYRSRTSEEATRYHVHPLGLVYRGVVGYLVGTVGLYDDPRQFALHRIRRARMLDEAARQLRGFSVEEYAQSGAFGFMDNGPIKLVLRMEAPAAAHLYETPLSIDQIISIDASEGWVCISATVHDTSQLHWWLLAFGDQVEVIEPPPLRRYICGTLLEAAARYTTTHTHTKKPS